MCKFAADTYFVAGVLAAVQAYIMESSYDGERFEISLSRSKQVQLLCKALTTVLWQVSLNAPHGLVKGSVLESLSSAPATPD